MDQENKNIDDQGEELFEHYHYVADKGQEKLRIDKCKYFSALIFKAITTYLFK